MNNITILTPENGIATLKDAYLKNGRYLHPQDISFETKSSIIYSKNKILWLGANDQIPQEYQNNSHQVFLKDTLITPQLVDCHTHLAFAGDRSKEFEQRQNGETYLQIAKNGGGILETVRVTSKISEEELYRLSMQRIQSIIELGVKTIEIKSGYGQCIDSEILISKTIHKLKQDLSPQILIINTFMAAHAVPSGFKNSQQYLNNIVLPALHKLLDMKIRPDFVDIFVEDGFFSREDAKKLFLESKNLGIPFKAHVDEFKDCDNALFFSKLGAASVEHLLHTNMQSALKMKELETIAVLLPGTGLFLGKEQANARKMLDLGLRVAIATDYNPGSCHYFNLLQLASIISPNHKYKLNSAELWSSITLNAANALNLKNQGALLTGMIPRFSFFKAKTLSEINYNWSTNLAYWPDGL